MRPVIIVWLALASIFALTPRHARAFPTEELYGNYNFFQGSLRGPDGSPVPDGPHAVRLSLWTAPTDEVQSVTGERPAGTSVWDDTDIIHILLGHRPIVPGSETVRRTDTGATLVRGTDYRVDNTKGIIAILIGLVAGVGIEVNYQWVPTMISAEDQIVLTTGGAFTAKVPNPPNSTGEDSVPRHRGMFLQVEIKRGDTYEVLLPRLPLGAAPKTSSIDGAAGGEIQGPVLARGTVSGLATRTTVDGQSVPQAGLVGNGLSSAAGDVPGVLAVGGNKGQGTALVARGPVNIVSTDGGIWRSEASDGFLKLGPTSGGSFTPSLRLEAATGNMLLGGAGEDILIGGRAQDVLIGLNAGQPGDAKGRFAGLEFADRGALEWRIGKAADNHLGIYYRNEVVPWLWLKPATGSVGIAVDPSDPSGNTAGLTVGGNIQVTVGGFVFADGSVQFSAARPYAAGPGLGLMEEEGIFYFGVAPGGVKTPMLDDGAVTSGKLAADPNSLAKISGGRATVDSFKLKLEDVLITSVSDPATPVNVGEYYKDNSIVAWAKVAANGAVVAEYGISSVAHQAGSGQYAFTLEASTVSAATMVPVVTPLIQGAPTSDTMRYASVQVTGVNTLTVFTTSPTFAPVESAFTLIVTGR